jgi:hypothetical protein
MAWMRILRPSGVRDAQALAKGLLESRGRWHYLGINNLVRETIGQWICQHLDRDNFYLDAAKVDLLNHLEKYIKARLGPVFEGG